MKIRSCFVSNSSTTAYIVLYYPEKSIDLSHGNDLTFYDFAHLIEMSSLDRIELYDNPEDFISNKDYSEDVNNEQEDDFLIVKEAKDGSMGIAKIIVNNHYKAIHAILEYLDSIGGIIIKQKEEW